MQWYVLLSTMSAQKCNTTKRYKRNCNFAIDCFRYADSSQLSTGFFYHLRITMLNVISNKKDFYICILQSKKFSKQKSFNEQTKAVIEVINRIISVIS